MIVIVTTDRLNNAFSQLEQIVTLQFNHTYMYVRITVLVLAVRIYAS